MLDLELIGAPAFALQPVGDTFVYVGLNQRLEALTGLRKDQLLGLTPFECLSHEVASRVVERFHRCVKTREAIEYEEHYDLPGGTRWWALTVTPVIDPATQRVSVLFGIAVDITRRRDAERASQEANARLALAMDVIDGGFWSLDVPSGRFQTSRPLAALVAGQGSPELGLDDYLSHIEPEDLPAADLSALVSGFRDDSVAEYRVKTFTGETRWIRCKRRLVRDESDRPSKVVGVAIDITEQKALQARYKQQAATDVLTGLANRRSLEVRAQDLILESRRTGRPVGLLLLDLDRFKPVNDRYGHAAGDAVLKAVADRLRHQMRDQDVVARIGGDEFAILLDDIGGDRLTDLGRRVEQVLSRPYKVAGQILRIGVSIGSAALLKTDQSLEDIALRADRALYDAKKVGRRNAASAA